MIAAEDHDGVFVEFTLLQDVEELTDAVVDVADGAVVGAPGPLDLLLRKVLVPQVADLEQPLAVWVLLLLGNLDLGQLDVDALVHVPELAVNGVGIVRVRE